jgi:hypothetical protein
VAAAHGEFAFRHTLEQDAIGIVGQRLDALDEIEIDQRGGVNAHELPAADAFADLSWSAGVYRGKRQIERAAIRSNERRSYD